MKAVEQDPASAASPSARLQSPKSYRGFWIGMLVKAAIVAVIVGYYLGYPLQRERASTSCGALAAQNYREALPNADPNATLLGIPVKMAAQAVGGALLEQKVERDYPTYPPAMVCSTFYYIGLIESTKRNSGQKSS